MTNNASNKSVFMHPCLLEFISYELLEFILYSRNEMDCKEPTALFSCPADATCIPLCDGVSGTIEALTIDENYEGDTTSIPINTLVVNLTNLVDDDDDDDISVMDSTA
jgi:hypothetical protein